MAPGKDFVVMGTDGLYDNLYDLDIKNCLEPAVKATRDSEDEFVMSDAEGVARCMAQKAYTLSKDRRYRSPFAANAESVGKRFLGGK